MAASSERGVQLWRNQSRQEIWRLERHGAANSVALSPAGDRVAVAMGDEVRVMGTSAAALITEACRLVMGNLSRDEWDRVLRGVRYRRVCSDLP